METYIILGKYTREGVVNIKAGPDRIQAARQAVEQAGGKWVGWYLTMGQYDFVAITEAPNAETAAKVAIATGMQGNIRTETLRAFTEEEFKGLVGGM